MARFEMGTEPVFWTLYVMTTLSPFLTLFLLIERLNSTLGLTASAFFLTVKEAALFTLCGSASSAQVHCSESLCA